MTEGSSAPQQPRFLRPVDGRVVGGVCAALARGLGADVTWVRVAFVLLAPLYGAGLVLYLLGWTLLPEE